MEETITTKFEDMSELAQGLTPLTNIHEEHLGYLADGHHDDAAMLAAVGEYDDYSHGNDKADYIGTYSVNRDYGQWNACEDDEENAELDWSSEPRAGLIAMTIANHREPEARP